jgi:hypothetical protein
MKPRGSEYMQTRLSTVGPPSLPCSLDADQEFRNRHAECPRNFTQAGKCSIRLSSLKIAQCRLVQPSTKGQLFLSPATAQSKSSDSSPQRESEIVHLTDSQSTARRRPPSIDEPPIDGINRRSLRESGGTAACLDARETWTATGELADPCE